MTLVMIWRSDKGISAAADTRISDGTSTITDAGPKLFQLPVAATSFGMSPPPPLRFGDVGLAFAGNTLSAQSTAAMASTCLQNLSGPDPIQAPSLSEIANHVSRCAELIVRSRKFARPFDRCRFEGAVFGYCNKERRFAAYVLEFVTDGDGLASASVTEFDLPNQVLLLGSGAGQVQDLVAQLTAANSLPVHPTSLLAKVIDDPTAATIGGSLQYATATENGVTLVPAGQQIGPHQLEFSVLGFKTSELGDIGGLYPVANTHLRGPDLK